MKTKNKSNEVTFLMDLIYAKNLYYFGLIGIDDICSVSSVQLYLDLKKAGYHPILKKGLFSNFSSKVVRHYWVECNGKQFDIMGALFQPGFALEESDLPDGIEILENNMQEVINPEDFYETNKESYQILNQTFVKMLENIWN